MSVETMILIPIVLGFIGTFISIYLFIVDASRWKQYLSLFGTLGIILLYIYCYVPNS